MAKPLMHKDILMSHKNHLIELSSMQSNVNLNFDTSNVSIIHFLSSKNSTQSIIFCQYVLKKVLYVKS